MYALLLFLLLVLSSCGAAIGAGEQGGSASPEQASRAAQTIEETSPRTTAAENTAAETTATEKTAAEATPAEKTAAEATAAEKTPAEAPGDPAAEAPEGVPKFRDFFEEGKGNEPVQLNNGYGSAGAIPAVKPFNFGRDPGGPEDKTMYLTIPKIGLEGIPVFNEVSERAIRDGVAHVPATGFPWQEGANVYVAGHRIGYPGTLSDRVFYDLDLLAPGDKVFVTDSAGKEYVYSVINQKVVPPENVEVMNPVPGKSLLSLQTCTLPNYAERIVVQAELV